MPLRIVNARYSCSSTTTRASSWAKVIFPSERVKSACRRVSPVKPFAPPIAKEGRQFFGGKLLAARVGHDQTGSCAPAIAARKLQQSRFILERRTGDFPILAQPFEVFIGQGLDGGILGLSDPGNSELHGKEILTAEARKLAPRTRKNSNLGISAPNPEACGYGSQARLRTGRGVAARRRDFEVSSESCSFLAVRQSRSRS